MKEAKFKSLPPMLKPYRKENLDTWDWYWRKCLRTLNSQIFKMFWMAEMAPFPFLEEKCFIAWELCKALI